MSHMLQNHKIRLGEKGRLLRKGYCTDSIQLGIQCIVRLPDYRYYNSQGRCCKLSHLGTYLVDNCYYTCCSVNSYSICNCCKRPDFSMSNKMKDKMYMRYFQHNSQENKKYSYRLIIGHRCMRGIDLDYTSNS